MSLDLDFDAAQQAMVSAVSQHCRERFRPEEAGAFRLESWRELADLGVLALAMPGGEGGAVDVVAVMEALGAAAFPGPLPATFLANRLLPEARVGLAQGEALVAAGSPPLLPFAPLARYWIEVDGDRAWRARPLGRIEPVETLAGEPWGRVALAREAELPGAAEAVALAEIASAAYLVGAGQQLLDATSDHVRVRRQFGRPLGEFQALAHPLAECAIRLAAARGLTRVAAARFDAGAELGARDVRTSAAAARLSASGAALSTAHVCYQAFGATGVLREGPVFRVARKIRQLASAPPTEDRPREVLLERLGLGRRAA